LADLSGANIAPTDVADALIASVQEQIPDGERRAAVEPFESALRRDERPDHPEWASTPEVMFEASDLLAEALDWADPMPEEEYDQELAWFLGDLACGEEGNEHVARGIAQRALNEPDRLFAKQLAGPTYRPRMHACGGLPEDVRSNLERLVKRPATKPAPANTEVPIFPGGRTRTR
jgi:hypothetical protein